MTKPSFGYFGTSNFEKYRSGGGYYADKTIFIDEFFGESSPQEVTLITRPRRFGKSFLLSMLEYFFDRKHAGKEAIFEGLAITRSSHWDKRHQYPVVSFSFKDRVTENFTPEEVATSFKKFLRGILEQHLDPWLHPLDQNLKDSFFSLLKDITQKLRHPFPSISDSIYSTVDDLTSSIEASKDLLLILTQRLYQRHKKKVIVLIDEYDAMINTLPLGSAAQQIAINALRIFLGNGLKDNPYIEFAIITGVQRVAKESIFSGLNNLTVRTVLDAPFASCFGFTQDNVDEIGKELEGDKINLESLKQWYNGYWIGEVAIYNPWSVIEAINLQSIEPHWLNTSSNTLVIESLKAGGAEVLEALYKLSRSETLIVNLFKGLTVGQIASHSSALWTLLIHAGYLTLDPEGVNDSRFGNYSVRIPNLEIGTIFTTSLIEMFDLKLKLDSFYVMGKLFLEPDLNKMQTQFTKELRESLLAVASFFDTAQGESYYHGLITGILLSLRTYYQILSNRESGDGRSDLLLIPLPTSPSRGYVLEFKIAPSLEALEETAKNAMDQILSRSYASAFPSSVSEKIALGIAFYKKNLVLLMQPL